MFVRRRMLFCSPGASIWGRLGMGGRFSAKLDVLNAIALEAWAKSIGPQWTVALASDSQGRR
jgi:hypothetical protein